MIKNIKFNPFLIALFAVLIKCLAFDFHWPEVVVFSVLCVKLGYDSFLKLYFTEEKTDPLKSEIEKIKSKMVSEGEIESLRQQIIMAGNKASQLETKLNFRK